MRWEPLKISSCMQSESTQNDGDSAVADLLPGAPPARDGCVTICPVKAAARGVTATVARRGAISPNQARTPKILNSSSRPSPIDDWLARQDHNTSPAIHQFDPQRGSENAYQSCDLSSRSFHLSTCLAPAHTSKRSPRMLPPFHGNRID